MTSIKLRGSVMRFVILVVAAAGTGALSAEAIQTMFPQTTQTFEAMLALGGNPSQFNQLKLSDLNPVKVYEDVMRKVTSRDYGASLNLPSSPSYKIGSIGDMVSKPQGFTVGDGWKRGFGYNISAQIRQNNNRAQDMINYGRNPMAWHGPPPH
jgi:hypothetical protein